MLIDENKKTMFYIVIAFIFSFLFRLIWVYQFNDMPEFKFNDQFMINTNDGYYWAEGARDLINNTISNNSLSPFTSAPSKLTAFLYHILPFSFESIIFYMPAFFASLIVIPIILIGKSIQKLEVGFLAALFASITWSYYNRTMVGYYDTDFLNIIFPTILLWSIIWAIRTKENKYLLFTALDILAYRWWYPQSYSLEFAFLGLIGIYLLINIVKIYIEKKSLTKLYKNKNIFFTIQLLSIMLLAMIQLEITLRIMLVFAYFMLFQQERWHKHLNIMFIMVLILFASSGGLTPIVGQLNNYVFKDTLFSTGNDLRLHYFSVMQTIKEASLISFETLANRISGHSITFILAGLGYIWLIVRHPIMLFGLPMLGLGLLAYTAGLRFTIYAVPILSFGIAFMILQSSQYIKKDFLRYLFIVISVVVVFIPNVKHIIEYKIPPVFQKDEVKILTQIKQIASRDDYMVSWWDYGYPIRYYADVNTLSDGGKHSGSVNFPTSFALLNNQKASANIIRLDVEYTEKNFSLYKENKAVTGTNIANMILDYGFKDANEFLNNLDKEIKLPKKTRDIFIYLPQRMIDIIPAITQFSNIDLMTGKKLRNNFFYKSEDFKEVGDKIFLGNNISLNKKDGVLLLGNESIKINQFVFTQYNKNKKLQYKKTTIDPFSSINVIFMKDYNTFLLLDTHLYNSMFIQLFVLENYDKSLYEAIILEPFVKVYKLKI